MSQLGDQGSFLVSVVSTTVAARPLGPGGPLAGGIAMRLAGALGPEASELEGDRIFDGAGLDSRRAKLVVILSLLGLARGCDREVLKAEGLR